MTNEEILKAAQNNHMRASQLLFENDKNWIGADLQYEAGKPFFERSIQLYAFKQYCIGIEHGIWSVINNRSGNEWTLGVASGTDLSEEERYSFDYARGYHNAFYHNDSTKTKYEIPKVDGMKFERMS